MTKGKGSYSKISATKSAKKKSAAKTQAIRKRKSKDLVQLQTDLTDAFGNSIDRISLDNSVNGVLIKFRYPSIIYDHDFRQKFNAIMEKYDIDYKRTVLKNNPLMDTSMALIYIYNTRR